MKVQRQEHLTKDEEEKEKCINKRKYEISNFGKVVTKNKTKKTKKRKVKKLKVKVKKKIVMFKANNGKKKMAQLFFFFSGILHRIKTRKQKTFQLLPTASRN